MTSHSSSGLGIYLGAHRRFRPKPPADGILKYKKKKEKRKKNPPNSHHLSPAERLGAGTSVRIHPVAQVQDVPGRIDVPIPHGPAAGTGLEPPAAKGGRTAHPSHALGTYLGSAKLVNRDDG